MAEYAKRRIRMQVRATPDAGDGTFVAKVSTYDLEYDVGWSWTEMIMSGCFADSISAHPTIPIFYNHGWGLAPVGAGKPTEAGSELTVAGRMYLEIGDPMVARVYQAMQDEALEEWSIGFWPEEITWNSDNPQCDYIVRGDLAEASICVRGANPDTGTLELNARRRVWIEGPEEEREREVSRLRSRFNVRDLGAPAPEPAPEPSPDPEPDPAPDPEPPPVDPAAAEADRARLDRMIESPHWRDYAAGIVKEQRK